MRGRFAQAVRVVARRYVDLRFVLGVRVGVRRVLRRVTFTVYRVDAAFRALRRVVLREERFDRFTFDVYSWFVLRDVGAFFRATRVREVDREALLRDRFFREAGR